jgi:transketolase
VSSTIKTIDRHIASRMTRAVVQSSAPSLIGMKTFGASAPLKELQKKFGFEPEQIVTAAKQLLTKN